MPLSDLWILAVIASTCIAVGYRFGVHVANKRRRTLCEQMIHTTVSLHHGGHISKEVMLFTVGNTLRCIYLWEGGPLPKQHDHAEDVEVMRLDLSYKTKAKGDEPN